MPRAAMTTLLLLLLAASSTASARAEQQTFEADRASTPTATTSPAVTPRTRGVAPLAATLALALLTPEVQAALQASPDGFAAAQGAATNVATAVEWIGNAGEWMKHVWHHTVAPWDNATEGLRPALDQAETLLGKASAYAGEHPEFATASIAAGTAGSAAAGVVSKLAKWGFGLGIVTVGAVTAGLLDAESARVAAEHVFGAATDTARQAADALRNAPWYERAATEAGAFGSRWGRHALEKPGMTTVFVATGWAVGSKLLALPFRLLSGRSRSKR